MSLVFLPLMGLSAQGYERDVHYDLTKYFARWAAFSETAAATSRGKTSSPHTASDEQGRLLEGRTWDNLPTKRSVL
jgi:hypothetical protein